MRIKISLIVLFAILAGAAIIPAISARGIPGFELWREKAFDAAEKLFGIDTSSLVHNGTLPNTFIDTKRGSEISIYDDYENGALNYLMIYIDKGSIPLLPNASYDDVHTLEGLKRHVVSFIKRYKRYFNLTAPFYDAIAKAVSKLEKLERHQVIKEGSVIVEVNIDEIGISVYGRLSIQNTTTPNLFFIGLPSMKRIREGKWTSIGFGDKFRFARIASSKITLTKDEAINMAMERMSEYFKERPDELCGRNLDKLIKEVKAEANYGERERGLLAPVWRAWVYFNETLPNGIYGFSASFWADTGDLWGSAPLVFYKGSEAGSSEAEPQPTAPRRGLILALLLVVLELIGFYIVIRRRL